VSAMSILVLYQVITRYIFNAPSNISEVVARSLFVWLTMFGGAFVFGRREHMNIEFIRSKFPPKIKICIEMFSELVIAVFAVLVMIIGGFWQASNQMIQVESMTQIPMGYIYSAIPISGILILFYFACNTYDLYRKLKD
jgi:TRAP-type C4-dicarboxylate transport system permease small subunit